MALEKKLMDLQARLKAETELSERENIANSSPGPSEGLGNTKRMTNGSLNRRPKVLGDIIGTPTRMRKQLDLPVSIMQQPKQIDSLEIENKMKEIMRMNGILNINNKRYQTEMKHLEHIGELGNGTCGQVVKMLHTPSRRIIAVKQMRRSGNSEENKRIIMDLDVVLKSYDCPFIVRCLGCFITESDVWICMELMATCFDRLLKRLHISVPEPICGKITLATVRALHYLKETHGVIHRDVKPSNILLDEKGNIKLCDFGISGRLVDSKARTKNAGCAAYMAPERIEPPDPRKPDYDIRADVWSLGITLVELATGEFPYKDCKCDFEVLSRVLNDEPPCLPNDPARFSPEFQNFVSLCLTKDYLHRPKYRKLLEHPFLRRYENIYVDVAEWYKKVVETCGVSSPALSIKNINNTKSGISGRTNISLSSPQPFRRRLHTPDTVDKDNSTNSLGKYYQHSYYRSASVSPNRYYVPALENSNKTYSSEENQSHSNAKQKITSYIKYHLGVGNNSAPPSPPPRLNRNIESASPRLLRRVSELQSNQANQNHSSPSNSYPLNSNSNNPFVPYQPQSTNSQNLSNTNPFNQFPHQQSNLNQFQPSSHQSRYLSHTNSHASYPTHSNSFNQSPSPLRRNLEASPCLPRRYVSPSPPMPPPRRLSECNSVPGSPSLNLRAKYSYTPEPTRRTLNLDL